MLTSVSSFVEKFYVGSANAVAGGLVVGVTYRVISQSGQIYKNEQLKFAAAGTEQPTLDAQTDVSASHIIRSARTTRVRISGAKSRPSLYQCGSASRLILQLFIVKLMGTKTAWRLVTLMSCLVLGRRCRPLHSLSSSAIIFATSAATHSREALVAE